MTNNWALHKQNFARDSRIIARRKTGETLASIAADFNISPNRVLRICQRHDREMLKVRQRSELLTWDYDVTQNP
jgi:hypothetical protein